MEIIGKKARAAAFVSALGLMVIGLVSTTSISAHENLTPIKVEVVPPGEPEMIRQVANLTRQLQFKRKSHPKQGGKALRGVHPKSHGCVAAKFIVPEYIRSDYKVGLFAKPRTYDAWIRYSNAAVLIEPDLKDGKNGSRGMAIKVLGLEKDLGAFEFEDKGKRNQDFLMINTPEFAFANVRDYLRLSRVLNTDLDEKNKHGNMANLFFLPVVLLNKGILDKSGKLIPPRPSESAGDMQKRNIFMKLFKGFSKEDMDGTMLSFSIVTRIIPAITVRNPLEVQYFSAAPFRFGSDRVMKFSVVPVAGTVPQEAFSVEKKLSQDPNFLALALKDSLAQAKKKDEAIRLSFLVQTVEKSQLAGREEKMIENAALAWSEKEFPFVKVADIVIAKDAVVVETCELERFTPWHALKAHEPQGGINRLRKPVYCESGKFRPDGKDPIPALCLDKNYK